jgi:hypothetical protein
MQVQYFANCAAAGAVATVMLQLSAVAISVCGVCHAQFLCLPNICASGAVVFIGNLHICS